MAGALGGLSQQALHLKAAVVYKELHSGGVVVCERSLGKVGDAVCEEVR